MQYLPVCPTAVASASYYLSLIRQFVVKKISLYTFGKMNRFSWNLPRTTMLPEHNDSLVVDRWNGEIWSDMVKPGQVWWTPLWWNPVRHDRIRYGEIRSGMVESVMVKSGQTWWNPLWWNPVRHGRICYGEIRSGMVESVMVTSGQAWWNPDRHGGTWSCMVETGHTSGEVVNLTATVTSLQR